MQEKETRYLIPLSIVIAGVLIGGALFMTQRKAQPAPASEQSEREQAIANIAIPAVTKDDHMLGNPDAPIVLVEYSDTDCPFCQRFHGILKLAMQEYGKDGKLSWVFRHFPIPQLHPAAPREALALECAAELGGNEKFWAFADVLYAQISTLENPGHPELFQIAKNIGINPTDFTSCLDSGKTKPIVDAQAKDAIASGGAGTPHNVLVLKVPLSPAAESYITALEAQYPDVFSISTDKMRVRVDGALPYEMLKPLFDTILKG